MQNKNVSQILMLMNDEKHINYLTKYLKNEDISAKFYKIDNLDIVDDHLQSISQLLKEQSFNGVVISSEIDKYRTENIPSFFSGPRKIIGDVPVIFFHPSKVHPKDRELIFNSIQEPFKALQGHDLETDDYLDIDDTLRKVVPN